MPHSKSNRISRARKSRLNKSSVSPTRAKKIKAAIRLNKKDEAFLRARALQRAGIYTPKKPIDTHWTSGQASHVNKLFDRVQNEAGYFDKGKTLRPFQRTLRGYKLTDNFKATKKKAPKEMVGIVRTKKGSIIPRNRASSFNVQKDGTITYMEKRYGKMRKIYTGQLNAQQTLAFMQQVENGTFQIPKGKRMRVIIFGSEIKASENDLMGKAGMAALKKRLLGYKQDGFDKLLAAIEKNPNLSPIKLEFWNA